MTYEEAWSMGWGERYRLNAEVIAILRPILEDYLKVEEALGGIDLGAVTVARKSLEAQIQSCELENK